MAKIIIVIEDVTTETSNIDARVMRFNKPSEPHTDTQACRLGDLMEAVLQAQLSDHGMGVTHMQSTAQH
jgi:hypothetical protein